MGSCLSAAEAPPNPAGHWEGAIVLPAPASPLAIQVDLGRAADQSWQGTIDIPIQGLHRLALHPLKVEGSAVSFGMPGIPGDPLFTGTLTEGATISGDFTQGGQRFPFKLDRRLQASAPMVVSIVAGREMDGRWQGSLKPAPGVELRLVLEIARSESGLATAVLISPDQGNAHIPVTAFSEQGGTVHFENAGIGGSFEGRLNGDQTVIAGDWKQAGSSTPLVLAHQAPAGAKPAGPSAERAEAAVYPDFSWLVLSGVPLQPANGAPTPDEVAQKKFFAQDLLASQGGETQIQPRAGDKCAVGGVTYVWKATVPVDGIVYLNSPEQKENYQTAYASTEFEVPAETQAWLGVGSDDGVRVWLNGVLVHEHWIGRSVLIDDDVVKVSLKPGRNRLLLKVQNMTGGWGFACRLMDEHGVAARLVAAAKSGDLTALKDLTGRGFDVNLRTSDGLTAFAAARIWGRQEAAEFLAQKGADTQAPLPSREALVDTLLKGRIGPGDAGAAVLVARDGAILYAKGFGLADLERKIPVTVDTKFRIGSITKQFTASGIIRLQESGQLRITDSLAKYYPGFPRGGEVTLQRLLTHTSGVHSYTDSAAFMQTVTTPTTNADLIETIKKFPFDFNPGQRWSYSNSGFFLLGDIIQKVSGREYGDYLHATFFAPLGMDATGEYRNSQPPAGAAVGYSYVDGKFTTAVDWDMSRAGGAGALYSTVGDLFRWNEAVFAGKVLTKEDLAEAFTPVVTEENKNDKADWGYGYGWGISAFRGEREISHSGGLPGFLSNLLRYPGKNFTVAVLINASPPKPRTEPGALSHEIAEIYLGAELAPVVKPAPLEAKAVSSAALEAIVGLYDLHGAILAVTREGEHAYVQLPGQPKFEIYPLSETEYFLKVVDARITFVQDASGKVVEAINHQDGQVAHGRRVEARPEIKLDDTRTDPLLGDYEFKGIGKLSITRDAGKMYCQLTGQPRLELGASSETEFFLKQVDAQLSFTKAAGGKVTKVILHQGGQDVEMPRMAGP